MLLNQIKEQQTVVATVGGFANSLQQIAAMRMMKLRDSVLSSKRFVEEATLILRELHLERDKLHSRQLKNTPGSDRSSSPAPAKVEVAIIVVTSDSGLCGSYNTEIVNKLNQVIQEYPEADYFIIGKKGQAFMKFRSRKLNVKFFPYNIPENVQIKDLRPLIGMFYYYNQIFLLFSKYINTTTRQVDLVELSIPNIADIEAQKEKEEGKYIFEPSVNELIAAVHGRIRYALFRQQILDSKLSLYTAQMIAMKTAADNAEDLMSQLSQEYNKTRRKLVDKKIQEVQAGRSLWIDEG